MQAGRRLPAPRGQGRVRRQEVGGFPGSLPVIADEQQVGPRRQGLLAPWAAGSLVAMAPISRSSVMITPSNPKRRRSQSCRATGDRVAGPLIPRRHQQVGGHDHGHPRGHRLPEGQQVRLPLGVAG